MHEFDLKTVFTALNGIKYNKIFYTGVFVKTLVTSLPKF